jgi:hypothetical protein
VSRHISKHMIWTAVWIISVVCVMLLGLTTVTREAFAQATPPPRPTPTSSDQATPVRSTPTPLDTPLSNETPVRLTPTPLDTPASTETPQRPTPTLSTVVPPPTAQPKPEKDQPEPTPLPTPYLMPMSGVDRAADTNSREFLIVSTVLSIVGCGLGVSLLSRRRRHRH